MAVTVRGQRRYDTVDLCAIIAKFNCIPMESRDAKKWQCNGDYAAIIASNADTEWLRMMLGIHHKS